MSVASPFRALLRARLPVAVAAAAILATLSTPPAHAQEPGSSIVAELSLRELGPAIMGGRVADLAVVEADPTTFYVGLASGGVWRTESHGMEWEPLFDDQPCSSVGDVTVYQANPNVIWVGTGEPQNRQSSPYGCGVFRSVDGGRSWTHLGLVESRHISRIRLHPADPEVAYVAAVGHLWGANEERGVYRTTDGGESWEKVLYLDENTGAIDLVMDPSDPNTLFAAMYQRRRTAFGFSASGGGSGIHRTLDGGDTWEELTEGLPEGELGRIGLDVYRRDGDLVYATVEAHGDNEGLYRSTDRGLTWEKVSDRNRRPMYFSMVRIDPNNPERIYLGGVRLSASDDGGRTWWDGDAAEGIHVDHHALWIDPSDSDHLVLGTDGGIATSWNGARSWQHHNNLAIGQFYEIGVDMLDPYRVCGGLQDNSSWCAPNRTLTEYGVMNRDWIDVWGGDGFYNRIDPTNPDILYTESQGGNSGRVNLATGERWRIRPLARDAVDDEEAEYDFNWNGPIAISHHDPAVVYVGANHLIRSRDRGMTWEEASPDLTRRIDRDTLPIMGQPVTDSTLSGNDGIRSYGNLTAISESPLSPDVIYAGTDDGNLQVTRDGGATWTNAVENVPGLGERSYVSRIEASHHDPGTVYATFDRHRHDDYRPYAYVSGNHGESWQSIHEGLPDHSVNVIREHPKTPGLLFLGNEVGAYVSVDDGRSWRPLEKLPTVPVDDLVIHPRDNDLVVGTHGRSIWILDDLAPLEELARGQVESRAHLFFVPQATQWLLSGGWPFWGDDYSAPRPPEGAVIRYWLEEELSEAPELVVTTAVGDTIRELETDSTAGFHQVVWDLREEAPVEVEEREGEGGGFFSPSTRGPLVLPGEYRVRLRAGDEAADRSVEVRLDPRVEVRMEDLRARQKAVRSASAIVGTTTNAERALDRIAEQVDEAIVLLEEAEADSALLADARALSEELDSLESELDNAGPGRVASGLESNAGPPTADQLWAIDRAWEEVPPLVTRLNGYITERLPALYERMDEAGVRPEPGEPVRVPRRPGG